MEIRPAGPGDLPHLEAIEDAADRMFVDLFGAHDWPRATSGMWRARQPGFLLVIGHPVVGFAHVLELDGEAHLEQVSVHPTHQREGAGTALVRAAMEEAAGRGHASLTLRTYRDVPWNAPFYARLGFVVEVPRTEFQRMLLRNEDAEHLSEYGPRVLMRASLSTP